MPKNKPTENNPTGQVPSAAKKGFLDSPALRVLLSLACALIAWFVVTMYFDQQVTAEKYIDTIDYSYNSSAYTSLGLDIVSEPTIGRIRVRVEGNGTDIGSMTEAAIAVSPNYNTVQGAGEATLSLQARIIDSDYTGKNIKLAVESPSTINVVFDTVSEKTISVTTDTSGVSIADGYVLHRVTAVPSEVTLRGPTSELDRIESVVATVTADKALSDNASMTADLELRDADGVAVDPQYATIDSDTATVNLSVYQVRELPLAVDFIGTPTGFDTSSLKYSLNYSTLRVAGPSSVISNLSELAVSSFDLGQEFAFGRDYQRQIELPNGVISQDGITTVTLSFDTSDMDSTTLDVTNIRTINQPSNIALEVLSSVVANVVLYGPADEIAALTADSVQAQVDCQNISVTSGQQTLPVTIQIPASSRIFAVGDYTVQCAVTAQ